MIRLLCNPLFLLGIITGIVLSAMMMVLVEIIVQLVDRAKGGNYGN